VETLHTAYRVIDLAVRWRSNHDEDARFVHAVNSMTS
jgi:hypothetical protein